MELKDVIKPPFANYDIVVYFGCGLFLLPFIHHYIIEPFDLRFPRFQFHIGIEFADTAISTLSLLFTVYVLGHMLAYAASYFIEKTVDNALGKISSAIVIANITKPADYRDNIQAWISRQISSSFSKQSWKATAFRSFVLLPVSPSLIIAFLTKSFDYFRTRIPHRVFAQLKRNARRRGYGAVGIHTRWYKIVEYDVINNNPNATTRMYNYLVIGGVFRSLSFVFLCCCWAEIMFWLYRATFGHEIVKTLLSDQLLRFSHITAIIGYNFLFIFSLSAYIKFSRRYAEEAIFSFVLSRETNSAPIP